MLISLQPRRFLPETTVSNGYTLTVQDQTATATTPAESDVLAQGIVIEATNGTGIVAAATQPGLISLAKADILGNATVKAGVRRRVGKLRSCMRNMAL